MATGLEELLAFKRSLDSQDVTRGFDAALLNHQAQQRQLELLKAKAEIDAAERSNLFRHQADLQSNLLEHQRQIELSRERHDLELERQREQAKSLAELEKIADR